jgi:hypothetical protein
MKLIIFTTCKPFLGDDAWRQEQAIKSWTLLEGIEKKIIIIGDDKGSKEICEKYNLIYEPGIRKLHGVPYLYPMFEIANKYADEEDIMLWTNSDMIYFNHIIDCIKYFKEIHSNEKNYLLVGSRTDWMNPSILENIDYTDFIKNISINNVSPKVGVSICKQYSSKYECYIHAPCGIDYVVHSKTTFINNINKDLVISGTRFDMIMVSIGILNNFFTCNISLCNPCIHQNHGYLHKGGTHGAYSKFAQELYNNNVKCGGQLNSIMDCKYKMIMKDNKLEIIS